MNQLTDFLATLYHSPCFCTVQFSEFYSRFIATLSPEDRPRWAKRETARELRKHHELFNGNRNTLFLADVSFRPYNAGNADESRMSKCRDNARFIDDGANGYYMLLDGDGVWRRISLPQLCHRLCQFERLTPEDVYQLRKHWRANPARPTDSFANPVPEFLNAHYYAGRAVPLTSLERRWPEIRKSLDARFPIGTIRGVAHVGNVSGPDSIHVIDRELVACFGELLPRDLTESEFELYKPHKSDATTLTLNQRNVRGWDKRTLSRAQMLTKPDY